MCLFDWQLSQFGSPAFDIVYILYTATDKEFRKNHYTQLLNNYLTSLDELLGACDCRQNVITMDILKDQLQRFAKHALIDVPLVIEINVANMDTVEEVGFSPKSNEDESPGADARFLKAYRKRLGDVLLDVAEYNYD